MGEKQEGRKRSEYRFWISYVQLPVKLSHFNNLQAGFVYISCRSYARSMIF